MRKVKAIGSFWLSKPYTHTHTNVVEPSTTKQPDSVDNDVFFLFRRFCCHHFPTKASIRCVVIMQATQRRKNKKINIFFLPLKHFSTLKKTNTDKHTKLDRQTHWKHEPTLLRLQLEKLWNTAQK
jgi:hypothetical protein